MFRETLRWEPDQAEAREQLKALGVGDDGGLLRGIFRGS
jgi:hypothetical protein